MGAVEAYSERGFEVLEDCAVRVTGDHSGAVRARHWSLQELAAGLDNQTTDVVDVLDQDGGNPVPVRLQRLGVACEQEKRSYLGQLDPPEAEAVDRCVVSEALVQREGIVERVDKDAGEDLANPSHLPSVAVRKLRRRPPGAAEAAAAGDRA
jgi:hypothetical protein